jgi:hypothetical protein
LGFWGLYFGLFGVGSFWKGRELLKGKIVEGKMLKGKAKSCRRENAKEVLTESLHRELKLSLQKAKLRKNFIHRL